MKLRISLTPSLYTRALLAVIIIASGYFHFHALNWNDAGFPHPDERAMVSQSYDMMVADNYKPTIHSWGHLGYYLPLFFYKTYIYAQYFLNGLDIQAGGRLHPPGGTGLLPDFRDLVENGTVVPFGIAGVLLFCLVFFALRWILRSRILALLLLILLAVAVQFGYPWVRLWMTEPVQPNYDDMTYVGRFLSAFVCVLSIPIIYDIGRRLYSNKVGLLAAAYLAFTVLGIQLSHFFAVDMLQAFCLLVTLWAASALLTAKPNPTTNVEPSANMQRADLLNGANLPGFLRYILRVNHSISWTTLFLYLGMGVGIGMSMASKFSSAPIFLMPVVAHILFIHRTRTARQFMPHLFFVFSYVAALGTWFYLQPYGWENPFLPYVEALRRSSLSEKWLYILFSSEFARSIFEQSQMVKCNAGGPWVQQFANTIPYVTMILQAIRWSFGWPLGVLCVGGFLLAMARNVVRPRAADILVLSWAGVEFLIIGSFKASFPRYTMGVIPFVALLGAEFCLGDWLSTINFRKLDALVKGVWAALRWPLATVGLISGFLYCVAYMQVYDKTHTWTYATLWIFKNAPERQPDGAMTQILHEEWDDEIPVGMSSQIGGRYGSLKIAPYHDDGESKVRSIAERLTKVDWICLPTTRLYGTTMTVPNKYVYTIKYYKALFAGKLGFTLRKTVTRPASLWGWDFDDVLADESHSVYDHPKCVMFEKTSALTANEYYDQILNVSPEVDALTRAQVVEWREPAVEQLLNIVRDPYPDDGAFTLDEVKKIVAKPNVRPRFKDGESEAFLQAAEELATTPALAVADVSSTLQNLSVATSEDLIRIRDEIERLPVQQAVSMKALTRLINRSLSKVGVFDRRDTLEAFKYYLNQTVVPKSVALAKIAKIRQEDGTVPAIESLPGKVKKDVYRGPQQMVPVTQEKGGWLFGTWQAIKWLLVLDLLGLAIMPLCCSIFRKMPDAGYPLARVLGMVVTSYLVWIVVNLEVGYFTRGLCWLLLILLAAACWLLVSKEHLWKVLREQFKLILAAELLFLCTFGFYLTIRAYNPEIFWGEKTMDFSFYNAIMRGSTFPPYEPWFSGTLLNYYYYGFILLGVITRLAAVPTAYGFNLALATVPALTVLCAFSLAYNLTRRIRWGLLGAIFVGFIGNLDPIYQLALKGTGAEKDINDLISGRLAGESGIGMAFLLAWRIVPMAIGSFFYKSGVVTFNGDLFLKPTQGQMWDSFWASSRATGQGMINEYPSWSWLFADLHAHVIVMPVSLLILSFIYLAWRSEKRLFDNHLVIAVLFLAMAIGSQVACNIWDFISYSAFFGIVLAVRVITRPKEIVPFLADLHDEGKILGEDGLPIPQRHPFKEYIRPPFYVPSLGLLFFIPIFAFLWPMICQFHPYWLGCIDARWTGLLIAFGLVLVSVFRGTTLHTTEILVDLQWKWFKETILPWLIVLGLSGLLFYHFHANLQTEGTSIKYNNDGNIFAWEALRHFGFFIALTVVWVFLGFFWAFRHRFILRDRSAPSPVVPFFVAFVVELALLHFLWSRGFWYAAQGFSIYACLLPPLLGAILLWRKSPEKLFCSILLFVGWAIAATSEMIVIIDRMNTVFKLYHHVWMFVAIGTAAGLGILRQEWMGKVFSSGEGTFLRALPMRVIRFVFSFLFLVFLFFTLACTFRGINGTVTCDRKESDMPTINGVEFLQHTPQEKELFEATDWLNRNLAGPQVIAEAFTGMGYDESTVACKYTGLPTILGWEHHTKQRGHTPMDISQRQRDLRLLYSTDDPAIATKICDDYKIRYVFLGPIERRVYQGTEDKLKLRPNLKEVFTGSKGSFTIYEVTE